MQSCPGGPLRLSHRRSCAAFPPPSLSGAARLPTLRKLRTRQTAGKKLFARPPEQRGARRGKKEHSLLTRTSTGGQSTHPRRLHPRRGEPSAATVSRVQEEFLAEVGVEWPSPWILQDTMNAHRLWFSHIEKKRRGSESKRPIADVFISAFAQRFQGLITRNPKDFESVRVVVS